MFPIFRNFNYLFDSFKLAGNDNMEFIVERKIISIISLIVLSLQGLHKLDSIQSTAHISIISLIVLSLQGL